MKINRRIFIGKSILTSLMACFAPLKLLLPGMPVVKPKKVINDFSCWEGDVCWWVNKQGVYKIEGEKITKIDEY